VPLCSLTSAAAEGQTADAATDGWREVLKRAAEMARTEAYAGELLWVIYAGDRPYVTRAAVRNTPRGGLVVDAEGGPTVELDAPGGRVSDVQEGWALTLPDVGAAPDGADLLEAKYDVSLAADDRLLDRRCRTLEIRRNDDGTLRERLWVDNRSGLLLRRETYDGDGEVVRLVAYLSLDLRAVHPGGRHASRTESSALPERSHAVTRVDDRGLAALREAGWTVPEALPGGFQPVGVFAVAAEESQPLQLVYHDGLYAVSLFQQTGTPDWSSLPAGAEELDGFGGLDGPVYAWPGAIPQRYVWTTGGRTWSLVSDAPADELEAIVAGLPQPEAPGFWERVGRGLGRLWSAVSPWE
jgi:sigma-E factor negative regulatory protein RseB